MAILALVLSPFPQAVNYIFPLILGLVATVVAFQMLRATPAARQRIALAMLPLRSQKLWAHYLLGRSLEALEQQDRAEQIYRAMKRYRDGFERLAASLRDKPDYPDIALARVDMADLEHKLA